MPKKPPAPEVIAWPDEQDEESLYISVVSLGEIEKDILKLRAGDRRRLRIQPRNNLYAGFLLSSQQG